MHLVSFNVLISKLLSYFSHQIDVVSKKKKKNIWIKKLKVQKNKNKVILNYLITK
jgi:uncharacterized membrane protein